MVTPQLIPAKGTELGGASYEYLDTDRPAGTVLYYLEDVDRWGTITRHGPVVVRPAK